MREREESYSTKILNTLSYIKYYLFPRPFRCFFLCFKIIFKICFFFLRAKQNLFLVLSFVVVVVVVVISVNFFSIYSFFAYFGFSPKLTNADNRMDGKRNSNNNINSFMIEFDKSCF